MTDDVEKHREAVDDLRATLGLPPRDWDAEIREELKAALEGAIGALDSIEAAVEEFTAVWNEYHAQEDE